MKKILIPACLFLGGQLALGQRDYQFTAPDRLYMEGKQLFELKNYPGCMDKLEAYKKVSKDADLIQEADFLILSSEFEEGISGTDERLKEYLDTYPTSRHSDAVDYMIGSMHFQKGEYEKAIYWFNETDIDNLSVEQQEACTFRLAYSLLQTGQLDKAYGYFGRISQIGDKYKAASTYYLAYIDYANKKYDKALTEFSKLKNNAAFKEQSLYYITQIYFLQNKYDKVISEGEALLSEYPSNENNGEICRIIGESAYHLGKESKAISMLDKYVASTDKPLRSALYILGVSDYNAGKYSAAIKALSPTVQENDALTQNAYLYLGQSYLKLGDKNNARMAFQAAATSTYDQAVRESAMYNYALLIHESGFTGFGESVGIFENFLNDYPNSKYADKVNDYLVEVYLTTKNYESALQSINKIKQPSNKILAAKQDILFQLGTQAFANSNLDEAKNLFTSAISMGNYDSNAKSDAYFWRGECDYKLGNYQNAIDDYRSYLNTTTQSGTDMFALAQYNLGYSYFKQKDYSEALNRFRRYTDLNPEGQTTALADAYNRIGDCLYQSRQYSAAEENYNRAARISPSAGDYSIYQKGFLLGLQKDYNGKITQMDKLISEYPESQYVDDALFEKGRAYVLLENSQAAAQAFNQLIKEFPQSSLSRKAGIQLGLLYYNDNQPEKAAVAYKSVISNYPGSEEARVAVQDLKSVYIDLNDIDSYANYVNSLGGNVKLEVGEQDSLTYIAAEKLFMRGDNVAASQSLTRYLQTYPNGAFSSNAHYYLGSIAFNNKQDSEALRHFAFVIESGDTKFMEDAVARTAEIQYVNENYNDAISNFKKLLAISDNPDNKQAARLGIMRASLATNQDKAALQSAEELLKQSKLSPEVESEARYVRAQAYISQNQSKKAVADLKELGKDTRTVQGAEAKYLLAQVYYDLKDDAGAEKVLEDFAKNGTPHQYWLARGFIVWSDIYIRQGDKVQARAYLNNLKDNYKGDDDIAEMIEIRLKKLND
jgi:TolA-binding protein